MCKIWRCCLVCGGVGSAAAASLVFGGERWWLKGACVKKENKRLIFDYSPRYCSRSRERGSLVLWHLVTFCASSSSRWFLPQWRRPRRRFCRCFSPRRRDKSFEVEAGNSGILSLSFGGVQGIKFTWRGKEKFPLHFRSILSLNSLRLPVFLPRPLNGDCGGGKEEDGRPCSGSGSLGMGRRRKRRGRGREEGSFRPRKRGKGKVRAASSSPLGRS